MRKCARGERRRDEPSRGVFGVPAALLPGGGGYGDPRWRDPALVAADVREGLVSRAAVRERYGVVVDENGAVDVAATVALRTTRPPARPMPT